MAKQLPAIDVTDAQFARVAGILDGANAAQKLADYEQRTKGFWREQVISADVRAAEYAEQEALEAARQAAAAHPDNP